MSATDFQQPVHYLEADEQQLDLRRYWSVVWSRKGSILALALLGALLGLYLALRAVPIYQGTVQLQIERDTSARALGDAMSRYYMDREFYATQHQLIRSWGVAEQAAERLGLLDAPAPSAPPQSTFRWRQWVPQELLDIFTGPVQQPDEAELRALRIENLQRYVRVQPVEGSQLALVSVEHEDMNQAAVQANAVADAYIDFLKDKGLENLETDQNWYASRLDQAKAELDQANRALQDFYERQGLLQTEQGADSINYQQLQTALSGQSTAQAERQGLERVFADINAARSGQGSLETVSALESRGVVSTLKNAAVNARRTVSELEQRYGPRHPRMIEARSVLDNAEREYRAELERAADSVVVDYRRAQSAEATYTAQVDAAKQDIRVIDRNRAERQKLEDAASSAKALFEKIQTGERTAGMLGSGAQKPYVTVIERARPDIRPVRPNRQRMVLLAGLLGLMLGVGLAFLLDYLDNTFRGADDVEDKLRLPLLGSLPKLKPPGSNKLKPIMEFSVAPKSAFSEAIRTVRSGVLLSGIDHRGASVIMVTSSLPGEGKTTLSTNLAYALGHMRPTLLIDADMRRPMVGKAHDHARSSPGLSSFMVHDSSFEESTIRAEGSDLTIMHAGALPPNPLELLGSNRFEQVVEEFRGRFAHIVLDCAPALAVSDAQVLSRLVDHVLYVIKADSTPHQAAIEGVQRMRRADAPLLGVVLNQITSGGRGYYYGKYYRYGYYRAPYYPQYYGQEDS